MTESAPGEYRHEEIEPKWQQRWSDSGIDRSEIDRTRPKHYALTMLPYPSGDLHMGHWYSMVPPDARARFMRMRGYNVLFPMGFDAFGLPAENAAIKRNIHPKEWTYRNIAHMRAQLRSMGAMFDWRREMVSADPEYYRWTQWLFLKLFHGDLAYRKSAAVDWCPSCNTTLAREQVWGDDRHCERCETPVTRKELAQWFFRVTKYAEELLDFSQIDWPERVQTLQKNWIGRSTGCWIAFEIDTGAKVEVFTTRPDTLWGVTFMTVAPEHELAGAWAQESPEVARYLEQTARQSDIQRETADREKTGVFTGHYAISPVTGERIPIWVADYVLASYGTGAVMGVPAHDDRDFEFARKFGLEIRTVIEPESGEPLPEPLATAYTDYGRMTNSGPLNGVPGDRAVMAAVEHLESLGAGRRGLQYRLRDWLVSRQRYWGSPIPIVYCANCGIVPVPEADLPVLLPDDIEWRPTGESPLKLHPTWRNTACPRCGGPAERETDTLDTFLCSSWYHLRYLSPQFADGPFDREEYDYWMPVDTYTGGIEHATMHLIYTRFFHKGLRDSGVTVGDEPMLQLRNQGIILGEDSEKMSKSRGNVVAPDKLLADYGADTMRAYLMFFARWNQGGPWSSEGISGTARWLRRVWTSYVTEGDPSGTSTEATRRLRRKLHQTIRSVTHDFETFEFNTIIAALMSFHREMTRAFDEGCSPEAWQEAREAYVALLAPVTPHIAEELWERLGKRDSVHVQAWPAWSDETAAEDEVIVAVQVNGKVRAKLLVAADISDDELRNRALAEPGVMRHLQNASVQRVIVVPGKLVSIVAG
ncbi:MAG TPA: leucine--tRNA ligase [Thermoanaerobaculia bacterium]|nr:leucine--tRNA ligase [Thermoanaerobaculia bacterium]